MGRHAFWNMESPVKALKAAAANCKGQMDNDDMGTGIFKLSSFLGEYEGV